MIKNTFLILEKINEKRERNLWSQGIKTWDDFLRAQKIKGIPNYRKKYYDRRIKEAIHNLYTFNSEYFVDKLPQTQHWRLYDFFKEDAVFLDIETSGLEEDAYVNVVGLFDGINTKVMVRNINLNFGAIKKELKNYKIIITFNGSSFDLPILERVYPKIIPKLPHFDLRHACNRIGLRGGLKQIEKRLGIKRENEIIDKLYGGDIVKLWRRFVATGDDYYLNLLVEYNEEDIINLRPIADVVYERLKELTLSKPSEPC